MRTVVVILALMAVTSAAVCPYGTPVENWFCGRGGKACPSHHFCNIAPDDTYAVCCPSHCTSGTPLLNSDGTTVYCGRGGVRCPDLYTCEVAPTDAWAVCCPI